MSEMVCSTGAKFVWKVSRGLPHFRVKIAVVQLAAGRGC